MKNASILTIILLSLVSSAASYLLPVSRIQKNNLSAAQISATIGLPSNSTAMQMGNSQNFAYYIDLSVGTPSQVLGVQFDTGSNILWLPTQKAGVTPSFNTAKSSSFTNTSSPGSVQYADGSGVAGTYGTDVLAIAGTPINITTQFLWVTQDSGMNFPPQIAGLVGMGYTNIPNFLDVAYQQGQIATPAFALSIATTSQQQQSYIYYNQIPEWITNSSSNVSVVGNTYWQVSLLGVIVGGIVMTTSSADVAVIDSGTSYFYLNANLFNNVVNNFFQSCDNTLSTPECPCSSTSSWPTFAFIFEGIEVFIQPSQYVGPLTTTMCTYNFGTLSTVGSIVLLGDIFFQGYIVTFNKLTS
jgi:hypothetical protein